MFTAVLRSLPRCAVLVVVVVVSIHRRNSRGVLCRKDYTFSRRIMLTSGGTLYCIRDLQDARLKYLTRFLQQERPICKC